MTVAVSLAIVRYIVCERSYPYPQQNRQIIRSNNQAPYGYDLYRPGYRGPHHALAVMGADLCWGYLPLSTCCEFLAHDLLCPFTKYLYVNYTVTMQLRSFQHISLSPRLTSSPFRPTTFCGAVSDPCRILLVLVFSPRFRPSNLVLLKNERSLWGSRFHPAFSGLLGFCCCFPSPSFSLLLAPASPPASVLLCLLACSLSMRLSFRRISIGVSTFPHRTVP